MQPKALDTHEPVVLALVEAVTAWQGALEQTLGVSGLTYPKWLLLRAIRHEEFVRGKPCETAIFLDVAQSEHMLRELGDDGWLSFDADGTPRIAPASVARMKRAAQAIKALHSVSAGQFSTSERAALSSLLHRMTTTLEDHVARHIRHAAWERDEMSMVVPDELRRVAQQAIAA
ncbi:hypothetical protein ACUXAV_003875 [Cupriavidus metallidurans]|jgi:hypothetical protein|uniref:Transcriptional regulator, MarR family n=1 Tax=Cupriavidus metallidurans (strain ATCC 43123 / DSM 2839 / NBRC 102507 / CH34) TaxID=266264 RepID=Q1LP58_CUPMC|nr:hypothetical protein [Cupriavidus metallidurans]ABF08068.1 Putative transcriptional regulator, MarR family [Cupriavidus metallidurans CH34]AVA33396.1 MarR family transcriptional regulator [Cupriavidus metallidurans]MDE4917577.1 MarR family transcriptional regulator [Cupriavidus metallidurans]QGS27655.1 MarR family transcriptional regulator [Cupriavidus metallidurans]UBM12195.1 MarR family transcriptional regulator [Cupriavidus metallidurans]